VLNETLSGYRRLQEWRRNNPDHGESPHCSARLRRASRRRIMFNTTKLVLATATIVCSVLTAAAATRSHGANAQAANYNVIPGYDSQGQTVAVPNPDRRGR
jgi:hypothetical protein